MAKASKRPNPAAPRLTAKNTGNKSPERVTAELAVDPAVTAAGIGWWFGKGTYGDLDMTELRELVDEASAKVRGGDLGGVENMLVAQATALNVMFGELARRSAVNMGEYLQASESYMRLALKAQAQCRATLETLATIKNPPVVFAKQANIAAGPQQVNNGVNSVARVANGESAPNGLLETGHGQGEPLDFGTTGAAIGGDPALAAVGAVDRPAHG